MHSYKITNLYKNLAVVTMLFSLLLVAAPINYQTGTVQKAEAITVVEVGPNVAQNTVNAGANISQSISQASLLFKEMALDGIFHGLAKMVLNSMTQSLLNWINSGFQGSPAFVTNLGEMLRERADQIAGDFIYNDPALNFLCSPFQLDVKVALAQSYQEQNHGGFASQSQCTLSDVSDNVEGFLNGSFGDGGWPAWFETTQNPMNTPNGAYFAGQAEMQARIANDRGQTIQELDWGKGFMSFKACDSSSSASGGSQNCTITTPGAVIADQVNKSLGAGQDALISADEVNEIIAALFAQLAKQAITGLNGLLGLGGGGSGGGGFADASYGPDGDQTYLEAMLEEDSTQGQVGGTQAIGDARRAEEEYQNLQVEIVDVINEVESRINVATAAHPGCFQVELPEAMADKRDDALESIPESDNLITVLEGLEAEYEAATNAQEQLDVMQVFLGLNEGSDIKNDAIMAQEAAYLEVQLDFEIDELNADINQERNRCSAR